MPLYIYIDESGKLYHKTKYQNYTAAVFTDSKALKKFESQFREAVKLVAEQSPELITKSGKEIKGSELWRNRNEIQQRIILGSLKRKKSYLKIFSVGVDLTGYDKDYWENEEQCLNLWTSMKQWLINDVIIKYFGAFIDNCYNKNNEKFILNVYVDKENFKEEIREKIVEMLEEPPINLSEKLNLMVSIGLNSEDYPGIQLADIVANGLQRGHKMTNNLKEFRNFFEENTKIKIVVAKTWRLNKKINPKSKNVS